jgi:hypothetical protein
MKKLVILIFLILLVTNCKSQFIKSNNLEVKKEISSYRIANNLVSIINIKLCNRNSTPIWFWIEKDDLSSLSDSLKIQKYFHKKEEGSDASLYEISMDGNIESFIPEIFKSFIKIILPDECFSLQIISKGNYTDMSEQTLMKYLYPRFIYYDEKEMLKFVPHLDQMNRIIFFTKESIPLHLELLMQK